MDKMHLRDLEYRCVIGTRPEERKKKQPVIVNITLCCDLSRAGKTDRLEDAVNYRKLEDEIARLVETSRFRLIERLAERVAQVCLSRARVRSVTVTIDKPQALRRASSAAVEVKRS